MIIDTSALIAILGDEPEAGVLADAIADADSLRISAATLLEASMVADGPRDPIRSARFDALIRSLTMEVEPVTSAHVVLARRAFLDFGRGSGSRARLNFGDCFSYALATERREPLLYVGDDFSHTDVSSALDV